MAGEPNRGVGLTGRHATWANTVAPNRSCTGSYFEAARPGFIVYRNTCYYDLLASIICQSNFRGKAYGVDLKMWCTEIGCQHHNILSYWWMGIHGKPGSHMPGGIMIDDNPSQLPVCVSGNICWQTGMDILLNNMPRQLIHGAPHTPVHLICQCTSYASAQ